MGEAAGGPEVAFDLAGQQAEDFFLRGSEDARGAVDDAEGAEGVSLLGEQGRTCIETNVWFARDKRVVGKARVGLRVGDDQKIGAENGVSAEGDLTRCLQSVQTDDGLEPLPVLVDQGDSGNRDTADMGCQPHKVIEFFLGRRVQKFMVLQGSKSLIFVIGQAGGHAASFFLLLPRWAGARIVAGLSKEQSPDSIIIGGKER
jgi:hypothetical protein